jgi:hypothetical protein
MHQAKTARAIDSYVPVAAPWEIFLKQSTACFPERNRQERTKMTIGPLARQKSPAAALSALISGISNSVSRS